MTISTSQHTIKNRIEFEGKALQTGIESRVVGIPSGQDTGISFTRMDIPEQSTFRITPEIFLQGERRTAVGTDAAGVQTTEHLLAALWGLGVDNISLQIYGAELPAMDGSALSFYDILKKAGQEEQGSARKTIVIEEKIFIDNNGASISIEPSDRFVVEYEIDYNCPSIGKETFTIDLDQQSFENEIAPARTFCLKKEAEMLLKAGLGQGATCDNTLIMDKNGPVGTTLRFDNEPVRHKVLDLVGDLYILGFPVTGKVCAKRSGHKLNAMLVKAIWDKYCAH
jgi:UDP-3-O-acyl N-acetylglucosamine deacetylase